MSLTNQEVYVAFTVVITTTAVVAMPVTDIFHFSSIQTALT